MKKSLGIALATMIGLVLMIYSASRTLDFLQATLPIGQKELAIFALAAFDGGLIAWTLFFMHGAKGGPQRAIGLVMIVVSLIGVVIGFGADTLITASNNGVITAIDPSLARGALYTTIAIIGINIAAVVGVHVLSNDNLKAMANEDADDVIEDATRKRIKVNAKSIAEESANIQGNAWIEAKRAEVALQAKRTIEKAEDKSAVQEVIDYMKSLRGKETGTDLEASADQPAPVLVPKAKVPKSKA